MTTPLKPLTENKVTAEIPTEAAAFRGWAIGAHKLVLINIRELADRQDKLLEVIADSHEELQLQINELNPVIRESVGRKAFARVDMLEGDVAALKIIGIQEAQS